VRICAALLLVGCVSGAPAYFRYPGGTVVAAQAHPAPEPLSSPPLVTAPPAEAASATATPQVEPLPAGSASATGSCAAGVICSAAVDRTAARASVEAQATCSAGAALPICTEFFGIPLAGSSDIVFLLDRSESMSETANFGDQSQQPGAPHRVDGVSIGVPAYQAGPLLPDKLTVAKGELLKVLEHLPDGTRIAIAFYDDGISWFAPQLTPLDAAARGEVRKYLASIHARGATATVPALEAAFVLGPKRVVLLSDGLPNFDGNDTELVSLARAQIRSGVRFDTVAIGSVEAEPGSGASVLAGLAAESGGVTRSY